jgi:hypothetical protein
MLPSQSLLPLLLFTLLLFVASLFGLAALGQFPRAARKTALVQGIGPAVLWGSITVVILGVLIAIAAAWRLIPWYAAVIAGGIAVLVAPLALQYFSDEFVDGRGALAIFAAIASVLALGLLWYMAG